ncbi:MAG: ribulose-phosphate 3-epimerase [Planctomycetales bacterium]|nr:ribulose-phosphate 3-epimerase [Planctomycetales bacterium]
MNVAPTRDALLRLRQETATILPSLLMCDFGNLEREIERLEAAGVRALHLDVMDGHFVPNLTYGMPIVAAIRRLTALPIDVHLMITDPQQYITQFVDAGSDLITVHAETGNVERSVEMIRRQGVGVGVAVNPATALREVAGILPSCDLLLTMSVDAGFGGQSFNPVALEKLQTAKQTWPHLMLQVDGGINLSTIQQCYVAGARLFVVGSAIFGKEDYQQAISELAGAIGR